MQDSNLRITGFGSSDASEILKFSRTDEISNALRARVSNIKGEHEEVDIFSQFFDLGNKVEDAMAEFISYDNENVESNPTSYLEGVKFNNFKILSHIDFKFRNPTFERNVWVELKATKDSPAETLQKYQAQLYWHKMLADSVDKDINVSLWVYDTSEIYNTPEKFDGIDDSKLSYHLIKSNKIQGELLNGLKKLDEIWDTIEPYQKPNEINISAADANEIPALRELLRLKAQEIELKQVMSDKKAALFLNMTEQDISSLKIEGIAKIGKVSGGSASSLDQKALSEFLSSKEFSKHFPDFVVPRKVSKRSGYLTIKITNQDE